VDTLVLYTMMTRFLTTYVINIQNRYYFSVKCYWGTQGRLEVNYWCASMFGKRKKYLD